MDTAPFVVETDPSFDDVRFLEDRIGHGRIEFEGRTAQELSENTLVKQYYLGV